MATDAERVIAEGVPLTLADGTEVRLRFGMRALKRLDTAYGGFERFGEVLSAHDTLTDMAPDLFAAITAASVSNGVTPEQLEAHDPTPRDLKRYRDAVFAALEQSFPERAPGEPGADPPTAQAEASPGPGSTTSPPSGSDAATPSSAT